ncbi:hypothetical protein CAPTEDRAFT_182193 [Capitella teleta]|uniref:Mitochondrial carrier protein n=1 Tax=Capitella teleta TaxID=283909 RepID=R7UYR8_CAPTE|nr:hypothetical protein CAPTEDRAFT_182193 [Capitella teleta]|eukprot:ELU08546.1 hypothetical protein CAPTEDRAFT_182193 [Capitella teleta]
MFHNFLYCVYPSIEISKVFKLIVSFVCLLICRAGGTAGAVITCPLEVVKTRLQSSIATFQNPVYKNGNSKMNTTPPVSRYSTCASSTVCTTAHASNASSAAVLSDSQHHKPRSSVGLFHALKHIIQHEGVRGLFKGLGPNLVGVAPSRAIYFYSYAASKSQLNDILPSESPLVHILSAACAGFTASTLTNPIWFIKTRLQLDYRKNNSVTVLQCTRQTWRESGLRGFYKGITASYFGISETIIHFVIYEAIKAKLLAAGQNGCGCEGDDDDDESFETEERQASDFLKFMLAGATSKTVATCVAYPHEVARTRLREEGSRYKKFWPTLGIVWREEGIRGLYRGLPTQLVRQIPNTAIMMSTYEAVVYLCSKYFADSHQHDDDF